MFILLKKELEILRENLRQKRPWAIKQKHEDKKHIQKKLDLLTSIQDIDNLNDRPINDISLLEQFDNLRAHVKYKKEESSI